MNPVGVQIEAGKVFLKEIETNVAAGTDFAFETTLSGRMYVHLLNKLVFDGWKVALFYLWIPSAEFSRLRVEQRVESGGHDIPDEAIARRYKRTVLNFMNVFAPLCDKVLCCDNSAPAPIPFFVDLNQKRQVIDHVRYLQILESVHERKKHVEDG